MPLNLQISSDIGTTAQTVTDEDGNTTSLTLSSTNVGIGTLAASQRLTLGSGNVFLPAPNAGIDGNLYFGGITDANQIGMRLFGGRINNNLQSGFIDVRAGTLADGLIFRVDTFSGGTERMRITAAGNVGIGTPNPQARLTLGSGNVLLPTANAGIDGNLYFGGITDANQIGMRLFGGRINNNLQSGFIDVRAGTLQDGLIFRVDTSLGATERMRITADGNIRVTGDVILQGADCAEDFDVEDPESLEPGSVMVIGEDGCLRQSSEAYDTRVAGVLSGAGDYRPGIVLDQREPRLDRLPVALTGKAFCKVDAGFSPIGVGDLLTTSPTPGHAMKAGDPLRSHGSVIGKALRAFTTGRGLIPVLIALH